MSIRLVCLLVLLVPLSAAADPARPTISAITVEGNKKTRTGTVINLTRLHVGDAWDPALALRAEVDLKSSGLFQDVLVTVIPDGDDTKLHLEVKEKHSWIVAPTFYFQPGNIGGGVGYGESNLLGTNKKLLLYAQYATADTLFFGTFFDPSIAATDWTLRFDVLLRRERVTEYGLDAAGDNQAIRESTYTYLNFAALFGRVIDRGITVDLRIRGAYTGFHDPEWVDETNPTPPVDPQVSGLDSSTELRLLIDRREHWNGVTRGTLFSVSHERSLPWSDFDYWTFFGKTFAGARLWKTHNLVHKGWFGRGYHLSFPQEFVSGGTDPAGSSLRGLTARELRGDVKLSSTVEYSWQIAWLFDRFALRGLVFWDATFSGYIDPITDGSRNYVEGALADPRFWNGVGGGIRVYVKTVVIPLVGFDVGYGLESKDWNFYLALGLTEL
jgi:outer membrane protein insertion porin family